jgi:hypothetical protein
VNEQQRIVNPDELTKLTIEVLQRGQLAEQQLDASILNLVELLKDMGHPHVAQALERLKRERDEARETVTEFLRKHVSDLSALALLRLLK